jgi:hypothetical protein
MMAVALTRKGIRLVGTFGAFGLCACSVGKGSGAASGILYEYGCNDNGDYCSAPGVCGTEANPVPYDLAPTFFAGEPIDDLREYNAGSAIMDNRIIIRLQRSGKRIEVNDVLTFDVPSVYEVARCVRGRVDPTTGLHDWKDTTCFRALDTGPGRLRIQFDSDIQASLDLGSTCMRKLPPGSPSRPTDLVGSAVSAEVPLSYATAAPPMVANGAWESWVEFQEFGSASQNDRQPEARDPISPKFHIEFGERIYATSFYLTLVDDAVVDAAIKNLPRPQPQIGGTLGGDPTTGRFDFDLQRGQGAQSFP